MGSQGESSSTQRVLLPSSVRCVEGRDEKDDVAPLYKCVVYAILYKSKTPTNSNRLFLGCPFFKLRNPGRCKFFIWLDDHVTKIGSTNKSVSDNEIDNVEEYFYKSKMEQRLINIENKLAYMERRKNANWWILLLCLFVVLAAVVVIES